MKKLLKSEICRSINSAHRALFTKKSQIFQQKNPEEMQNIRLDLD